MKERSYVSQRKMRPEPNGKPEAEGTKKQGNTKGFEPAKRGCYEEEFVAVVWVVGGWRCQRG